MNLIAGLVDVDQLDWSKLGILSVGQFSSSGAPLFWSMDFSTMAIVELPLWVSSQPVLWVDENRGAVYIRGMFSRKLTDERLKAMETKNA